MQLSNEPEAFASQEEGVEQELSAVEESTLETVDHGRRTFLRNIGAGVVALAASTLHNGEAQAQQPRVVAVANTTSGKENGEKVEKPMIQEIGPNMFVVRENPTEPNGEGMRGPSVVAPAAYTCRPITISTRIQPETSGQALDQTYLLNLPRDIGEIARLGSIVEVRPKGLKDVTSALSLVVSQPNNNRFLSCRVRGTPTGEPMEVEMEILSWMSQPIVPMEGAALLQASSRNKLVNNVLMQAATLNAGVRSKLEYDINVKPLNPDEVNGKGDCGTFAVCVEKLNPDFKTVIGYSEGAMHTGGRHAFNQSSKGNVRVDAPFNTFGASRGEYVVTAVGTEYNFEQGSGWESRSAKHKSFNGWQAIGAGDVIKGATTFSVPGQGEDGATLTEKARNMKNLPQTIKDAHFAHVKARKAVNSLENLRKALATK